MGIYNPNCYGEGYDNGFKQAENGKSKDYVTDSPKLKSLLSENAVNTYIKGIDDGYKDGKRKSHGLYEDGKDK
ncbi:MAG: hypothetical protein LBS50_04580 [Prevotellaceae bacterium]|jgi:hypothetical protein|nr:hypothetical protein [Prevotellaceae bacterium]